jgi:hypothetical protein
VLIIESEIVPRLLYQAKFQTAGFEAMLATKPKLPILANAAIYDFRLAFINEKC